MDNYRNRVVQKAYKVEEIKGSECPWRVRFFADGEECGGGQYRTSQQADDAGLDYMFSGWGDD